MAESKGYIEPYKTYKGYIIAPGYLRTLGSRVELYSYLKKEAGLTTPGLSSRLGISGNLRPRAILLLRASRY